MPNAGALNRRVTIQRPSTTQDEYGQPTQDWQDVVTTWASIRAVTSKEVYTLGPGFTSQVTHTITIRYRPEIDSAMRINYRGRIFPIQAISDLDESRVELNLYALEIDGGRA